MINITDQQWQVLINILGAVETGGQIYGQRRYDDYTEAYTNSSAENSITLGAFQEFNWLAKGLLQEIKDRYPTIFSKFDNADIAGDLKKSSWNGYNPKKNSAKAKAIVNIINSPEGRKVQDERFIRQMKEHVAYGEGLGVTDVGALFEVCNIAHQGGYSAVKRILSKTSKPYTADTIYTALCTDSGANQVGTYKTRQSKVYQWIKQYLSTTNNSQQKKDSDIMAKISADDVINVMIGWLGLSRSAGTHKPIIDLYNSYTPRARGYAVTYTDDYCDTTVSAVFIKLGAVDLIGGTECGVEEHVKIFKNKGIWIEDGTITPQRGDIIVYNWGQTTQPNDGWADHIGFVESVVNGMINTIEGNTSGGKVARRQYPVGYGQIRGFARPKYGTSSGKTTPVDDSLRPGSTGEEVKLMQQMLIALGYSCGSYGADGDWGNATSSAVLAFRKDKGLSNEAVYDAKMRTALQKAYKDSQEVSFEPAGDAEIIDTGNLIEIDEGFPKIMFVKNKPGVIRNGNSKKDKTVAKLGKNDKVAALGEEKNDEGQKWYKVAREDFVGYIISDNLRE